jgi:hypothetical protein
MCDDGVMMAPGLACKQQEKQNPAFVKLLETVTGPSGTGCPEGMTADATDGTIEN